MANNGTAVVVSQIQSHRAELYAKFSAGFRDFLDHGQEAAFARLTQQLTPAFNEVSKQVCSRMSVSASSS